VTAMNRATSLLLVLGASACYMGPSLNGVQVAHSPHGAVGSFTTQSRNIFTGELLAVQDTGLVVLRADLVTFVPWPVITELSFEFPKVAIHDGQTPTASQSQQLRSVSRFPQGLTPELEERLLAAYKQTSIEVLRQ